MPSQKSCNPLDHILSDFVHGVSARMKATRRCEVFDMPVEDSKVPADFMEPIVHRTALDILTDAFHRDMAVRPYIFLHNDGTVRDCEHNKAIFEIYDLGFAAGKKAR